MKSDVSPLFIKFSGEEVCSPVQILEDRQQVVPHHVVCVVFDAAPWCRRPTGAFWKWLLLFLEKHGNHL